MGVAVSTILIAVGAILAWGIDAAVPHANLRTIGIIVMIVGIVGFLTSLALELPRRRVHESREVREMRPGEPTAVGSSREERVYEDREVF